jgi:hypothetical protein
MPKVRGENFRAMDGSQSAKFVKVFSLESFLLYCKSFDYYNSLSINPAPTYMYMHALTCS